MHNADLTLVPALATLCQMVDPTTWRFTLRRGVTFHDGTPLTAEDVVPADRVLTSVSPTERGRSRRRGW
jgi:peptide/nickel transport system substrate-binding protein